MSLGFPVLFLLHTFSKNKKQFSNIYIYLYTRGFHSIRSVLHSKINIRRLKLPLILPFYFFILITYIKKKKRTKFRQNLEANRFIDNNIAPFPNNRNAKSSSSSPLSSHSVQFNRQRPRPQRAIKRDERP